MVLPSKNYRKAAIRYAFPGKYGPTDAGRRNMTFLCWLTMGGSILMSVIQRSGAISNRY